METHGWEWAVKEMRELIGYIAHVKTNEDETFITILIEDAKGSPVFVATAIEPHVVQSVIDSFTTAMYEILY